MKGQGCLGSLFADKGRPVLKAGQWDKYCFQGGYFSRYGQGGFSRLLQVFYDVMLTLKVAMVNGFIAFR